MILPLAVTVILPILLSLLITPWVIRLAILVGATDQPNERKIHNHPMPRIGGVAVYLSYFLTLFFLFLLDPALHEFHLMVPRKGVLLIASLLLVMALGLWDDLRSLSPKQKFFVQILAASLVYAAGFRISAISHLAGSGVFDLGIFAYPVTVFWIVGITNAFNLIDGLDGLSSGVATISLLTMFAIAFLNADLPTAFMALALAGAIIGFLRYNFNPARIFLGDCGSLFIGFTIAVLSIQSSTKGSVAVSVLVPILALGLPIMDTLLSMLRRLIRSFLPRPEQTVPTSFARKLQSIFQPDKAHIHHKLIARGVSHRKVVLLLYLVSCAFGLCAFAVTVASNIGASLILIVMGVATLTGIRQLQYSEMAILHNGALLPLYKSPFFRRSLFQGFLDLGFIALAFTLSYYLTVQNKLMQEAQREYFFTLTIVSAIQLVVFLLSGLYKRSFQHLGMGDVLKIGKSVVMASALTWVFFSVTPRTWNVYNTPVMVLDFYMLLTFVAGVRLSYQALDFLFRRGAKKGKNVLIYGATNNGVLTLQQLLHDDTLNMNPIGFLDDNPHLEGMCVNDFPVFGGHWKLQGLLNKYQIDEILLATNAIQPEVFTRMKLIARRHGIHIKQAKLLFEDISLLTDADTNGHDKPPINDEEKIILPPSHLPGLELSNL